MGKKRICRVCILLLFTLVLGETVRTSGGLLGAKLTTVKADDLVTGSDRVFGKENIFDTSRACSVILENGTKEFFEGYPIDMSFLSWVKGEFGAEPVIDIAYELFEGNYDSEAWYTYTGNSIHVLWINYCKSMNYSSKTFSNIIWKDNTDDGLTTIAIAGDMSFADDWCTTEAMNSRENGIKDCFSEEIFKVFEDADISMVNHEFTLTDSDEKLAYKGFNFKTSKEQVSVWKNFDIDFMALANNHVYDYKEEGLLDTISTLKDNGYVTLGAGENIKEASYVQYVIINGRKIAFINSSEIERAENLTQAAGENVAGVFKCLDETKLLSVIESAKKNSDYVVCYVHWGFEGYLKPDTRMQRLAKEMVSSGADAIVGGHPHRLQGIDFIDGVPVAYSLGNFWFSSGSLYTAIAEIEITKDGSLSLSMVPCLQRNMTTSVITDTKEKEKYYKYLADISFDTAFDPNGKAYDIENMTKVPYAYQSGMNYSSYNSNLDLDGRVIDAPGNIR